MLSRGSYAIFFTRSYSIAIMVSRRRVFFTISRRVKKSAAGAGGLKKRGNPERRGLFPLPAA